MQNPLPLTIPEHAEREMVVATRPNAIDLNRDHGFKTHIYSRVFLTDTAEYLVPIGDQLLKIQTPHRITFGKGEECYVDFTHVMWYPEEDESAEAERAKRQLV
jgi:iron(III) transport system ATP-binding protein